MSPSAQLPNTQQDRVSLGTTHSVDQGSLKLKDPTASASCVLGLKVCTTPCLAYQPIFQMSKKSDLPVFTTVYVFF